MMRLAAVPFILCIVIVAISHADSAFVCFRKYSALRDACKGQPEGETVDDVISCCTRHSHGGYAPQLKRHGSSKKTFECSSCADIFKHQQSSSHDDVTNKSPDVIAINSRIIKKQTDVWSEWSEWGPCSSTCQPGVQQRTRFCLSDTTCSAVSGDDYEERTCVSPQTTLCAVAGGWGNWTDWSECSVSCGSGQQSRSRQCDNPAPRNGGQPCSGLADETRPCSSIPCPVNGNWSDWTEWTLCSKSCGEGVQSRSRRCDNPAPQYDGKSCDGDDVQTRPCPVNRLCPVNGGWSDWSRMDACTAKPCSGLAGFRIRFRSCTKPRPMNGGVSCQGRSWMREPCYSNNNNLCTESVDGGWCQWSEWSQCDVTSQLETRSRTCQCPPPANNGTQCQGAESATRSCDHKLTDVTQKELDTKKGNDSVTARCHGDESSGDGSDVECDSEDEDKASGDKMA